LSASSLLRVHNSLTIFSKLVRLIKARKGCLLSKRYARIEQVPTGFKMLTICLHLCNNLGNGIGYIVDIDTTNESETRQDENPNQKRHARTLVETSSGCPRCTRNSEGTQTLSGLRCRLLVAYPLECPEQGFKRLRKVGIIWPNGNSQT
jgi:hypothetical protein